METLEELKNAWNAQADKYNQWDELGHDEIVAFAQQRAIAAERERCARICEVTFVEPGDMQVCTCKEAADKIRGQ